MFERDLPRTKVLTLHSVRFLAVGFFLLMLISLYFFIFGHLLKVKKKKKFTFLQFSRSNLANLYLYMNAKTFAHENYRAGPNRSEVCQYVWNFVFG